jgi:hypothetical protein
VTLERRLHDPALNPAPASMNDPNLDEAGFDSCVHVLLDDRRDVARGEGVEVELGFDWYSDRIHSKFRIQNSKFSITASGRSL